MEPPNPLPYFLCCASSALLILQETGRSLGVRHGRGRGFCSVWPLLMAFAFFGATMRFNEKRMSIAEEVNQIETAYLRLHLVPREMQVPLQDLFCRCSAGVTALFLDHIFQSRQRVRRRIRWRRKLWNIDGNPSCFICTHWTPEGNTRRRRLE